MNAPDELKTDVAEFKKSPQQQERLEKLVKFFTAVVAISTLGWGVLQYRSTTNNDFRKIFWEHQFTLYQQATAAAATIATAGDIHEADNERLVFWRLYYGQLSMIEHPNVKNAMRVYGEKLVEVEQGTAKPESLKQLSYRLARACRLSLKQTWNPVSIGDIPETIDDIHRRPSVK